MSPCRTSLSSSSRHICFICSSLCHWLALDFRQLPSLPHPPASFLSTEDGNSVTAPIYRGEMRHHMANIGQSALHNRRPQWMLTMLLFPVLVPVGLPMQKASLPLHSDISQCSPSFPPAPRGCLSSGCLGPHRLTDSPTGADASEVSSRLIGRLLSPKSMLLLWKKLPQALALATSKCQMVGTPSMFTTRKRKVWGIQRVAKAVRVG